MAGPKTEKMSGVIWSFFSSVRLAITLLIVLAITSIVGTVIPQAEGAREFAMGLSPQLFRIFNFLGLFDMYHSLWFRLLMEDLLYWVLLTCMIVG